MATEAVLFGKLGENEVVEAANFGKNQQKKLRRFEHPPLPGCKDDEEVCHSYREMHPYRDAGRADGVLFYQELKKTRKCSLRQPDSFPLRVA
jgi:hypothetical protein